MITLLALSHAEVRERVAFALGARYPKPPLEAGSARDAIDLLAKNPAIRLVICEYPGISEALFRHLVSLNRQRTPENAIRCIVCTSAVPETTPQLKAMQILAFVTWGNLLDGLFAALDPQLLPVHESAGGTAVGALAADDVAAQFCRIKTLLLIRVGPLSAGISIRLSDRKFVRLFQEGDVFDDADYRRILTEKKLEHLYLRREDCGEFIAKFRADLLQLLRSEILGAEPSTDLLESVHETVQELLEKLGPTREIQDIVKANVQLTIRHLQKSPRLADLLKSLQVDARKYIAAHSLLLPQIAGLLASGMDWKSDLTYQKLTLAAFLHDVTLTNPALAQLASLEELAERPSEFTAEEAKAFKNHSLRASELAKQFHEIPPDVDTIILQHHERPDGSGFPRGLTHSQISPLAAVFIVAHEMVHTIFAQDGAFDTDHFVAKVQGRYVGGTFKKLLKVLTDAKIDSANK